MNILVSACLLGVNCKYNGGNNCNDKIKELMKEHVLIPVCPEQLGGLTTPRVPSEIQNGDGTMVWSGKARIFDKNGKDVTENFVKGAEETLRIARLYGCSKAILKANSPSCGCGRIYDGTFSGRLTDGSGTAAQLLLDHGIEAVSDKDFEGEI